MHKFKLKEDLRLHISVIIIAIISILIGPKNLNIGGITIVFSPLIWAMILAFALYMSPIKAMSEKDAPSANSMMSLMLAILIAKLGVASGSQLEAIKEAGLALVLQNFGNL